MGRADLRLVRATNLTRLYREQAVSFPRLSHKAANSLSRQGWRRRAQELEVVRSFAMKASSMALQKAL